VKKYLESKKITYPIAVDREDAPAWGEFNVKAIPAAFLIDQKGQIVAQWTGAPASMQEVERELNRLLTVD
jgi:peroxiredoxin